MKEQYTKHKFKPQDIQETVSSTFDTDKEVTKIKLKLTDGREVKLTLNLDETSEYMKDYEKIVKDGTLLKNQPKK